ncbi:MAG: helix-turn-helix domain-containing protein [Bacteroidota bacterium]
MRVQEYQPDNPLVKKFVSKYQLFEGYGPFFVKAIPSGTCECWVLIEGSFEIFNTDKGKFEASGKSGFFPLSCTSYTYYFKGYLKCFNIKLKPNILGLPTFFKFLERWKKMSPIDFLSAEGLSKIKNLDFSDDTTVINYLDQLILETNDLSNTDQQIETLLSSIFSPQNLELKINELAKQNYLTVKSFERLVTKVCGMPPKKLLNIVRFGKASTHLKKSEGAQLIDALEFGYYDQSHFIKECKRITNLNPKEFLSKLQLDVADLVFDDISID